MMTPPCPPWPAEISPYRLDHFDPANLPTWAGAGYDPQAVTQFLSVLEDGLSNPNVAISLRVRGSLQFW